jgi:plastocyanin
MVSSTDKGDDMTTATRMNTGTPTGGKAHPRWTALATMGFAMAAAGSALLLIAGLAYGLDFDGEAGFFAVTIAVPIVALLLVRRFGTWAKAVGIVLALGAGFMMWWTVFGLFAGPSSFFEFVSGMLFLPGVFIALGACIGAIVAKRRGHLGTAPEGGERRWIRTVGTILAVGTVVSGIMMPIGRSTASSSGAAARSIMKNFDFSPVVYTVAGGSKIFVRNDDPFSHDFSVDALNIQVSVKPGSSTLITIPARAGSYILYCSFHTDDPKNPTKDDMAGTLTVT